MRFADVIGHEDVKRRLVNARREGRIAHALLFLGPEGSGNLPMALAFAQYLFCSSPEESDSCGTCINCRKVSSLQFADLFFSFPYFRKPNAEVTTSEDYGLEWRNALLRNPYLDVDQWNSEITSESKQLNFTVHEAAHIIRRVSMKGYEGSLKIMLIWMADLIKPDTANKLLKVLEEPPANTLFFLVANSAESMLATILSRTQVIRIPALPDSIVAEALITQGVEPVQAESLAHYAAGNWNRAQLLKSTESSTEQTGVQFQAWMRFCYKRDVVSLMKMVSEIADKNKEEQKQFITYALEQIRQNLVLNYAGKGLTRMNQLESDFSAKFSPFINDLNSEEIMEQLDQAYLDISRNVNPKIVFSDMSFRMHRLLHRKP